MWILRGMDSLCRGAAIVYCKYAVGGRPEFAANRRSGSANDSIRHNGERMILVFYIRFSHKNRIRESFG